MTATLRFSESIAPDWRNLVLASERLILRPVQEQDAEVIFSTFTEKITIYMLPKAPEKIQDTLNFIRASQTGMDQGRELVCSILDKRDQQFLGCCGLHARPSWPEPELGIWIRAEAHGHGYGREAVQTLTAWGFANLRADYLVYPVDRNNLPSRAIPESMQGRVFAEKKVATQRGTWLDEVIYRIPRP
jgi:RimJ/RimL family protein N-acetyltransferase